MSQLLQVATRDTLRFVTGVGAPDFISQGIPFDTLGVVQADLGGVIAFYHQGLPFTADSRIVINFDVPVGSYGSGAAPFDANGRLVVGSGPTDHYSCGIPYTASGQVAVV